MHHSKRQQRLSFNTTKHRISPNQICNTSNYGRYTKGRNTYRPSDEFRLPPGIAKAIGHCWEHVSISGTCNTQTCHHSKQACFMSNAHTRASIRCRPEHPFSLHSKRPHKLALLNHVDFSLCASYLAKLMIHSQMDSLHSF